MAGGIIFKVLNIEQFTYFFQAFIDSLVKCSGISIVPVEFEQPLSSWISFINNWQHHVGYDYFHLGLIKSAIFGFGAIIDKSIIYEFFGVIKVNRIDSHETERENETIFGEVE